ncbi:PH domain-containing protein [Kordiimonas sp.]|uniref:PH domain-containing protein n=1 Tax=Kordiimonas sp. TaxID=1970157 RepID=UPI003A8DC70E
MSDASAETSAPDKLVNEWQRLSPVSIVYFVLSFIMGFAKHGIQNAAIFGGIFFFSGGDNRLSVAILVVTAALALLLAASVLSYLNFRFRINKNAFLIHKGVINKKRLTLSFDRIQNIALKEPVYFRPFGLVNMALESAGSANEEVSLAGIDRRLAEQLRQNVLGAPQSASHGSEPEAVKTDNNAEPPQGLIHHPIGELVRYGLSNNNVWVFAGLAAGAISQVDEKVGALIKDWLYVPESYIASHSTGAVAAVFAGVAVLVLALLLLGSVLGAIVIYYDYRLSFSDDRFHRLKGLFERSETSLPRNKIQALGIAQPWTARLMHRSHLTLKQIGFAAGYDQPDTGAKQTKFIIPSMTDTQIEALLAKLYPDLVWGSVQFTPINKLYLRRLFWLDFMLPSTAVAVLLALIATPWLLLLMAIPLILYPLLRLRYLKYGYWTNGKYIAVRRGLLGHNLVAFPIYKVQDFKIKRTPGQRRKGLATLVIKLAGHKVSIPYIPYRTALVWRTRTLHTLATDHTPWM